MALTTKAKIAAATAAAVLFIGGGVVVVNLRAPAHPSVGLSADLAEDYELREGENVRLLRPPFPAKRDELLKSHLDPRMVRGMQRWDCVFDWHAGPEGRELRWRAGTLPRSERERHAWVAQNVLGLQWYNLGEHGALTVPAGDWIVRADRTIEQKLEGYAKVLERSSGRAVTFDKRQVRRNCIVWGGGPAADTTDRATQQTLILTTASPPFDELTTSLAVEHTTSFQSWCARAGLPFIDETENSKISGTLFSVMPDAVLKRGDPHLRSKLDRVLRNLEQQIGGTFTVVPREVEVWTPVVR